MTLPRPTKSAPIPRTIPAQRRGSLTDDYRRCMHQGLRELPHDSTVLAIGCEQAFLSAQLPEYASAVTVLDTSAPQIAQLAPRFPEISFQHQALNQTALPFSDDTFDAIWCCEFLDRVFDPAAALREMFRVLLPGGEVHVTAPCHGAVRNVLSALASSDTRCASGHPRVHHFTRAALRGLARAAGFQEIGITTTGSLVPRTMLLSARKPLRVARQR